MKDLIERLEQAAGPDRALDYDIWKKCAPKDGWNNHIPEHLNWLDGGCCQPFTSSIDAALTLVPEGYRWAVGVSDGEPMFFGRIRHPSEGNDPTSKWLAVGISPAIALCIAALKARTVCEREGSKPQETAREASATS